MCVLMPYIRTCLYNLMCMCGVGRMGVFVSFVTSNDMLYAV